MFELCVRLFAWGLDTSLKAVLVAVVVAGVLRMLRLQDSHIRHRVWTGVLIGMFLLPVLTPLMPVLRLPLMPSPDWLFAWIEEPALIEAVTTPVSEVQIADTSTPILAPLATQLSGADQPSSDLAPFQSDRDSPLANDSPKTIVVRQFSSSQIEPSAEPQPFVVPPSSPSPAGPSRRAIAVIVVFLISGIWLSVSSLLFARLGLGLWLAARLRRFSLHIDPAELPATSAGAANVHESYGIRIPLTVGCLHPLILLPAGWRKWPADKLHAVLAHEQMHVQRGDCVVALLAELNCCLYWFHPLASWLKANLAALAEQACDDAAIQSIGDRARYARHLLDVAADVARNRGRFVPAGLSMARRSNVEQRILSILDFTRPLSHRLTWTKALFVLSVMVPLIALAAALQPFSRPPSNEEPPAAETNPLDNGPKRPIAGRLIDPEGRPIAAASIRISTVISPKPGDSLDKLLQAWKQGRHNVREVGVADTIAPVRLSAAQTDSEGRFTLPSVPLERMYVLEITGSGIAASNLWVANREGVDVAPYIEARPTYFRQMDPPLLGTDFTHVLLPDFKLTGRVTDDNGQPIAGVEVSAVLEVQSHKSVVTDADGRYELAGLPRDVEVLVCIDPSDERMLGRTVAPKARIDEATKTIDVTLKAGILVTGRVTDPQTGKGIHGGIRYVPLPENEYAKQPGYDTFDRDGSMRHLDSQGRFSFLIIPGPGVLVAQAWGENSGPKFGDDELSPYRAARFSAEDLSRIKSFENDNHRFLTAGETIQSLDGIHAAKYVNFAPGSPPPPQNLKLDRGKTLKVDFVDAADQPVTDVFVAGIVETWPITAQLAKSRETIYALGPDRPRKVFALHATRNLAGVATLSGDEKSTYRFTLQPAATLRGRAVDEGGAPLANQDVGVFFANDPKDQISELYRFFPGQKTTLTTDQDGHFQMKCLLPGEKFFITFWRGNHHFVSKLDKAQQTAQPAQTLDLGNVIFAPDGSSTTSAEDETSVAESDEKVVAKRGEARSQEPTPNAQPPAQEPETLNSETYRFAGTVKDDRGQPVAGANISLSYWSNMPADESLQRLATTDADGKFSFTKKLADLTSKTSPRSWIGASLIVAKSGYGFSIASIPALETSGRLIADLSDRERSNSEWHFGKPTSEIIIPADDAPIRGRIVDSEGQPVADVKVVAAQLWRGQSGKLDEWLVAAANPGADDRTAKQHLQHFCQSGMHLDAGELSSPHALILTPVHSDADGSFTLTGLGRDRIVELYLSGPGIASMTLLARTRHGEVIRLPGSAASPERGTLVYHPATFTCIAPPTAPVEGRVTDRVTGKPLAGWLVQGFKLATNNVHGSFEAAYNHTKTAADGRFRLEGLPLGDNIFRVVPPKKSGYFSSEADVTTTLGAGPIVRDVAIRRGVITRGRVTDSRTGKPVNGGVSYFAFSDNPHLRSMPGFGLSTERVSTDKEGRYEITILPGSGLLTFMASPDEDFPRGAGADQIEGPKQVTNAVFFRTEPYLVMAGNTNLLSAINPAADATEITHDLALTSGKSLTCRVRREDGQPLDKTYLYGQQSFAGWFYRHTGDSFQVRGYFPDSGRRVMVYQPEGNLVGWQDLTGDVPEEFDIVLKPAGMFVGRIVDNDGAPMEGLSIGSAFEGIDWEKRYSPGVAKTGGELPAHLNGTSILTDKNGRFELPGVVPGLTYAASVSGPAKFNGRVQMTGLGRVFENASAEAGEKKNLGDLRIKQSSRNDEKLDPKQEGANPNGPMPVEAKKEELAPKQNPAAPPPADNLRGRVVGADGNAVANASVYWFQSKLPDLDPSKPRLIATTDASGEFSFAWPVPGSANPQERLGWTARERLLISAPGHGFALSAPSTLRGQFPNAAAAVANQIQPHPPGFVQTIKLPKAGEPLRGRLVNIDGQPVAGASVKIRWFEDITSTPRSRRTGTSNKANETPEQSAWADRVDGLLRVIEPIQLCDFLPSATTDATGQFELRNLGENRLFQLLVTSDATQSTNVVARNQPGESLTVPVEPGAAAMESLIVHANNFTAALGPSKPLTGRILDLDTNEPIAGAVVRAFAVHGNRLFSSRGREEFSTTSDAQGRYCLTGLPLGSENHLIAFTSGDVPYIPIGAKVDTSNGDRPEHDFRLKRGLWAQGRVFDAETDKPFTGEIKYYRFRDETADAAFPGVRDAFLVEELYYTSGNGEFRVPVMPTRGVLTFRASGPGFGPQIDRYPRGAGAESIAGGESRGSSMGFQTFPQMLFATNYQRLAEVNPKPGDTTIRVDLPLVATLALTVKIIDAEGKPVVDCEVYGATSGLWQKQKSAECAIEGLAAGDSRKVFAFHRDRKLAGGVIVKNGGDQPAVIKLQNAGSLSVRLVEKDGEPITDAVIHVDYDKLLNDGTSAIWANHATIRNNPTQIPTDENGRFELTGLIPGWNYSAYATAPRTLSAQKNINYVIGYVLKAAQIQPGENRDLGDVKLMEEDDDEEVKPEAKPDPKPAERPTDQASGGRRPSDAAAATTTVTGSVLLTTGQPAANTHVAIVAFPNKPRQGGELTRNGEVLAEGKTDDAGRFQLQLKGVSSTSHKYAHLIARHDGSAIAWQKLNLDKPEDNPKLKLEAEEPIRGRLIDLEGQPASNITLRIRSVMQRTTDEWSQEGIGFDSETLPAAWLAPLTTDADGRFAIHGVSSGHGVGLNVAGSDRFASQDILLNTGMAEQRGERDATYRSLVRNAKPGEEIVLPLSPSQVFEGTIRYADTKEPVPHARISIWASQQRVGGSMTSVEGQTDAAGHYRITPRPGIRFGVKAYPPNGVSYLVRETTDDIRWESGDRIKQVDLSLPPGILIRGKVLSAGTKEPVAGASIQFIPQASTSSPPLKGVVTGWQGIQLSGKDGAYQIAVPPVPGHLLVNHDTGNFILSEIGSTVLYSGKPGGQRHYSHAIHKIDPAPDANSLDLTIELQPGAIVSGRIVDPQNQPVDNAVVVSRLHIWSGWLTWHGNTERWPAAPGHFELKGLKEGVEYPTHFLDPKRRLGASANLKAGETETTIVLEPCGSATARFLDEKGQPLADFRPNLDIIITPGVHRYDFEAQRAGQLAADSDFAANVDRTNHGDLKADAEGKLTIFALIPGATYAIRTLASGRWQYVKEFQVRPGQTLDLGEIVQPSPPRQ